LTPDLQPKTFYMQAVREGLRAHPVAGFDPDPVKAILHVPDSSILITLVILGYPGETGELSEKHRLSEESPRKSPLGRECPNRRPSDITRGLNTGTANLIVADRRLILVGAGHAHLTTIANLDSIVGAGVSATVTSLGSYQYYSGMGPGLLSGRYDPGDLRFNIRMLCERRGARFVEGRVVGIRPGERRIYLEDRSDFDYDVISFNIGSVVDPRSAGLSGADSLTPVKPVHRYFDARCSISNSLNRGSVRLVVVGGGPAGVETAAIAVTLMTQGRILKRFPARIRKICLRKLKSLGIAVLEDHTAESCREGMVVIRGADRVPFDYAFLATGTSPPRLFESSPLTTGRSGGLLVGRHLNSTRFPEVFGGGDCIDFEPRPLAKVGVYAVRQNQVLLDNLRAALSGQPLRPFEPQKHYHLALNFGDGTGLSHRSPYTLGGRPAFWLKDRIDRSFVRKFQLYGEADEVVRCP